MSWVEGIWHSVSFRRQQHQRFKSKESDEIYLPLPYFLDWKESGELEVLVFWMPDWMEGEETGNVTQIL